MALTESGDVYERISLWMCVELCDALNSVFFVIFIFQKNVILRVKNNKKNVVFS